MSLQELAVRQNSDFTTEQLTVIKDSFCKGATDTEFKMFINVCKTRQLNPFASQLFFVKRWDSNLGREVGAIQTGIGAFRAISESTGKFAGETQVLWIDQDGAEHKVWLREDNPLAASAGVLKIIGTKTDGSPVTQEIREVVYWDAVVQKKKDKTPTRQWTGKAGAQQLGKCAKAAAHRAAFGEVLADIYSHEEMAHLQTPEQQATSEKTEATKDFLIGLDQTIKDRLVALGADTQAKQRVICNEAKNDLDALILHLEAAEYANSMPEAIKAQVKFSGYRNAPEIRRMLVSIGREKWNEKGIKAFLAGEAEPSGGGE